MLKEGTITDGEHNYVMKCWELANETEKLEAKYKRRMMEYIEEEVLEIHYEED